MGIHHIPFLATVEQLKAKRIVSVDAIKMKNRYYAEIPK